MTWTLFADRYLPESKTFTSREEQMAEVRMIVSIGGRAVRLMNDDELVHDEVRFNAGAQKQLRSRGIIR